MNRDFWTIPKSIAKRKGLSFKAKLIAGVLFSLRDSESEAFPSRSYMAEALGVSTSTIDRGIKELKEKIGLKTRRRGFGRSNLYLIPDWLESSKMTTSEEAGDTTLEETGLRNVEKATETNIIDDTNNNFNKYTKVDDKKSSVKEVFSYFRSKVRAVKGFDPEMDWSKDGKLAKKRLRNYSLEEIKQLIDWYLSSKHCERLGVSLAVCLSAHIINLWKAEKTSASNYEKLYQKWQQKE